MALDSDFPNADERLSVVFYTHTREPHVGKVFIEIRVPGDDKNFIDRPSRDDDKSRFPRQWINFQAQNGELPVIGLKLEEWARLDPTAINSYQIAELQILKFQTVEQVAMASDGQLQRVGMGGIALRESARNFLKRHNASAQDKAMADMQAKYDALQSQMEQLLAAQAAPKRGRPPRDEAVAA